LAAGVDQVADGAQVIGQRSVYRAALLVEEHAAEKLRSTGLQVQNCAMKKGFQKFFARLWNAAIHA
jgi:hypothetical protein